MAKCADCIDQLATYFYLNRNRDTATVRSLQLIVNANASLWNDLFEKILNALLFNKKSEEALSRPIHSIYLIDSGVAEHYYSAIAATQPRGRGGEAEGFDDATDAGPGRHAGAHPARPVLREVQGVQE